MQGWPQASSATHNRTAAPDGYHCSSSSICFPGWCVKLNSGLCRQKNSPLQQPAELSSGTHPPTPTPPPALWGIRQCKLPSPVPDPISLSGSGSGAVQPWPRILSEGGCLQGLQEAVLFWGKRSWVLLPIYEKLRDLGESRPLNPALPQLKPDVCGTVVEEGG